MRGLHLRVVRQLARAYGRRYLSTENDIYKAGTGPPPSIVGSVICAMLEGKGRGIIARHSVAAGDLLMCLRPAVVIEGLSDTSLDPALLVPNLIQAANAEDVPDIAAALKCLYNGTDASRQSIPDLHHMMRRSSSSSSCCDHNHDHQHQHDHQSRSHGSGRSDSSSSSSSHSSATSIADSSSHTHSHDSSNSSKPEKLTEDQAALLVKFNAFGDDYEDLAAAAVRGAAVPHSHMGLWPQFAMFNHACLPNAVHYNVGHALVVRAMEDVPAGDELTVSYLGREEFAPVGARQAVLQERWGFACGCARCQLEQKAPKALQRSLEQIYATVARDIRPKFLEAVEQQNHSQLTQVYAGLQQQEDQLNQQLQDRITSLSDSAILVMQAAVYDLFELLLFCEHLVGVGNQSERLHNKLARTGRCVAILNCVSKGAELHVYMASRMLQHAVLFRGDDSVQAQAAAQLFLDAFKLRYGSQLEAGLQVQLMEASKQVAEEFLL